MVDWPPVGKILYFTEQGIYLQGVMDEENPLRLFWTRVSLMSDKYVWLNDNRMKLPVIFRSNKLPLPTV